MQKRQKPKKNIVKLQKCICKKKSKILFQKNRQKKTEMQKKDTQKSMGVYIVYIR